MHAFRIGRVQEFEQPRQPAGRQRQFQGAVERQVQFSLFAHREGPVAPLDQPAQPGFQKFEISRVKFELQRIHAGRNSVPERQVATAQCPYQDFEAAILVEQHLRGVRLGQHAHQKSNEYRLARSGGADDTRMANILAAATVLSPRVTGMQREIERRACVGDEHGERIAPVIAGRPPDREVVKRRPYRQNYGW